MTKINDGGPAYPCVFRMATPQGMVEMDVEPGMTMRDAAALAALQGYCANPHLADDMGYEYNVAARAWAAADAFIAAREAGTDDAKPE